MRRWTEWMRVSTITIFLRRPIALCAVAMLAPVTLDQRAEGAPLENEASAVVQSRPSKAKILLTGAEEPAAKGKTVTAGNLKMEIPEGWEFKESTRQFREAEIKVPAGEGDKEPGEIIVYYFGEGGAGGIQANIDRWVGQFEEKGRQSKVTAGTTSQGKFTMVELSGTYKKPVGPPIAGQSKPMPNWRVLGAIVETESGPYFVKFDGPDKTVTGAAKLFRSSLGVDAASEKPVEKGE